ncbi:MAG TPA: CDP-glycerol glycerophosphotransferase family protein [Acidimicrobiia bacterium]|jgi:CDP-glycerol glycerophosphotransferase (TagB/SpsB family)|nr:CDP-glycerol glycerophosphotransferase family protein [Acidimicrobiia bacterium]
MMGQGVNRILDLALRPFQFAAYFLSGLIPRDETLWVFGSWSGRLAGDNAGAFFEYVSGLGDAPRCVWVSADPEIVRDLRAKGLRAESRSSLAGWMTSARAGVFLYDGLTNDVNHWVSRGARKLLLRHGVGIKKIERAIDNRGHHLFKLFHGRWWQRLLWAILIPWHLSKPDWCLATSPEHADQAVAFFDISPDRVWITGFPRHDKMLHEGEPNGAARAVTEAMRRSPRPVFLYMPTFRDRSNYINSWGKLNEQARRADVDIYVKLHFVDFHRAGLPPADERRKWERLIWVGPESEPTDLYASSTGLVTDYSSVAFDMLLVGKPIIYFIPDFTAYVTDRSLLYPIEEVTPGPKCATFAELGDALIAASTSGLGPWRDDYERVRERFHTFRDGDSSPRVYQRLIEELGLGAMEASERARSIPGGETFR